jgi:hypothetical protein
MWRLLRKNGHGTNTNLVMGIETKSDCADEGKQQFTGGVPSLLVALFYVCHIRSGMDAGEGWGDPNILVVLICTIHAS